LIIAHEEAFRVQSEFHIERAGNALFSSENLGKGYVRGAQRNN
jgi:hypothetical protein